MSEVKSNNKYTILKELITPIIWVFGVVFTSGIVYSKVSSLEHDAKKSNEVVGIFVESQAKTLEGIARIEGSQKEFANKINESINRLEARQIATDHQVIRNKINIENLEKSHSILIAPSKYLKE